MQLAVILKAVDFLSGPLKAVAGAIDAVDRAAGRAKELRQMGENIRSMGKEAMMAGAVVAGAMVVPIRAYAQLEDAATRAKVAFMTSAGVDPVFAQVERQAVRLGSLLPGTTADFMQMAAALKEGNVSALGIANGGLEATANLRVLLGNLAPDEAGRMLATFRQSLGVAEDDFVKFVDLVQRAKFGFGLDPQDFATSARYIAPIAKQLGIEGLAASRQLLAISGMMSLGGIRGEPQGTALRQILLSVPDLEKKTKSLKGMLRGVQLEFFRDGKFLGLENLVAQLGKLSVLSDQQKTVAMKELFGEQAMSAAALLASQGVKGYRESLALMERQASTQQRMAAVGATFLSLWEAATGTMTNTLAAIGAAMGPELKALTATLNSAADAVGGFVTRHPTLFKVLGLGALLVGALMVVFGGLAVAVGTAIRGWSLASTGLKQFIGVVRWVWAIVAAHPFLLAIAAVALATYQILKHWDDLKAAAGAWLAVIESYVRPFYRAGANLVGALWRGIKSLASKPIDAIRDIVKRIRDHLPFSPAKEGPLRDIMKVRLVESIADTMKPGPMMRAMRVATAATLAVASVPSVQMAQSSGSARRSTAAQIQLTYAPTIHLNGGSPAVKAELDALLRQHERALLEKVQQLLGQSRKSYG